MSTCTDLATVIDEENSHFVKVCCDASINFEREKTFALQILNGGDYLRRIALSNPDSLRAAINNVAAIGISLNPASKLAYLVPRKSAVCLDISYIGLMNIAQQSGAIKWGQAKIVRAKDEFIMQAVGLPPIHNHQPFDKDRGEVVGVYCVVKTDTDDFLVETMSIDEVYEVRNRSEAWKTYKKDNSKTCPWVTDPLEMARKTVVKRASKYWPRRDRLDKALHYLNTDGGEGLPEIGQRGAQEKDITPVYVDQVTAIKDRLSELNKTFAMLEPYFTARHWKGITCPEDLTAEQATAVLAFIAKKAA